LLAKRLNLDVIAEGVETRQQLDYLRQVNCDFAQGNFISEALPFSDFQKLLDRKPQYFDFLR
jgi:EAL domain-containing protein (putative c-di-GMP-specific phosphodiesterase class I)